MKYKTHLLLALILVVNLLGSSAVAQQKTDDSIQGKYIIINNLETFFEVTDNQATCYLTIYNIMDDESSKPYSLDVNDLSNVVKFSIKSSSEEYENQRNSKLVLKSSNHLTTFYKVLVTIGVENVILDNEIISIDDFYSLIK